MNTAKAKDTCLLSQFVELVANGDLVNGRLTVNDLTVAIRHERMSELSDWSSSKLDSIELHAAQFAGESPINSVFELPFDPDLIAKGRSVSNLCAPSPFAWT